MVIHNITTANIFKGFFAGIRGIGGGRSAAYEAELGKARELALQEMAAAAEQNGGNAVAGIDLDYEVVGRRQHAHGIRQRHGRVRRLTAIRSRHAVDFVCDGSA